MPELFRSGVLTIVDIEPFKSLCQSWERWQEANQAAKNDPKMITKALQCMREYRIWCAEFGVTPASRARIRPVSADIDDDEDLD